MKTNNLRTIVNNGFLGFGIGLISLVAQPAIAESVDENRTPTNRGTSSQLKPVSLSSESLLSFSLIEQSEPTTPATNQLAKRQLDLAQFCQNYPYNSKCSGVTPSGEQGSIENSPTSIPVPQADENTSSRKKSGWAIVPEVSTLGLGGHVVRKITPNVNARLGVNNFGRDINVNETDYEYKGNLNLFNVSTLVDYQPFKKVGIRLSSGLVFGNNNVQGTADVSERVANGLGTVSDGVLTIRDRNGNQTLPIENLASFDTDIEINEGVSPYLGIGGGNAVKAGKGLGFWWDLGVVFSGSPNAEVTSNFSTEIPPEIRERVVAQAEEELKEEEKELNEALDVMGIYPVLSLGLSYQF
jgi:hypothetical protein